MFFTFYIDHITEVVRSVKVAKYIFMLILSACDITAHGGWTIIIIALILLPWTPIVK